MFIIIILAIIFIAGCREYNVLVLPKDVSIENSIKEGYQNLIEGGKLIDESITIYYDTKITIYEDNNNLILKESHVTCQ